MEAPTPELTSQATNALVERLAANKDGHSSRCRSRAAANSSAATGSCSCPPSETEKVAGQLAQAEPLVAQLATDPSLRGLVEVLQMGLTGVELEKITLDAMLRPLTMTADTVEAVCSKATVPARQGRMANFSWHELLNPSKPDDPVNTKRKFIDIQPQLDFTALEPGKRATDAIRKAVADLKLAERLRRARAPHRSGPDRGRGIRDRAGGHAGQQHRHGADRAGHSVARAQIRTHHLRGVLSI